MCDIELIFNYLVRVFKIRVHSYIVGFQKIPVPIPRGLLEITRKVRTKTGNSRGIGEGRFWNNTLKY